MLRHSGGCWAAGKRRNPIKNHARLKLVARSTGQENSHAQWHEDAVAYRDLLETMLRFPKPLVAAVNGPAAAGGVGLLLGCDVVVAADNA